MLWTGEQSICQGEIRGTGSPGHVCAARAIDRDSGPCLGKANRAPAAAKVCAVDQRASRAGDLRDKRVLIATGSGLKSIDNREVRRRCASCEVHRTRAIDGNGCAVIVAVAALPDQDSVV